MNESYFQNKVKVPKDGHPNNLKLKIPSATGGTVYKRDYRRKNKQSYTTVLPSKFVMKESSYGSEYFGGTMYNKDFPSHKPRSSTFVKKEADWHPNHAPGFHDTHYKNNFLNWGGLSNSPSMKPTPQPVANNIPIQSSSTYQSFFTCKPYHKTEPFKPSPAIKQPSSYQRKYIKIYYR